MGEDLGLLLAREGVEEEGAVGRVKPREDVGHLGGGPVAECLTERGPAAALKERFDLGRQGDGFHNGRAVYEGQDYKNGGGVHAKPRVNPTRRGPARVAAVTGVEVEAIRDEARTQPDLELRCRGPLAEEDRKSTRLNS